MFKKHGKNLVSYFIQGVLLVVPVAITIYVVVSLLQFIDGLIPVDIPGLGILILVCSLTILGVFGSSFIASPIKNYFNRLMNRTPILKSLYSTAKDITTAFVGKKKSFNQPVLVKMRSDSSVEKLGFITSNDLSNLKISADKVAVYLPHSYAFSGNLFIVPKENVTLIDAKSADVMKFIVSGGVTTMDSEEEIALDQEIKN